jgi:hypothetical protein
MSVILISPNNQGAVAASDVCECYGSRGIRGPYSNVAFVDARVGEVIYQRLTSE